MKTFLGICIIAMVSAGIYGTIDLAKDIRQGTLIQYEKEDVPKVKSFSDERKKLAQAVNFSKEETKNNSKLIPTPKLSEIKMEYFSRGEPMEYTIFEVLEIDSTKKIEDSTLVLPTESVAITKTDSSKNVATLDDKKERKFSLKLYSRSKPRTIKKEEIVIAQTDSLKKE